MRADIELHQGEVQCAADRFVVRDLHDLVPLSIPRRRAPRRYARLGRKDADDAIRRPRTGIGEHRYAIGILLRAKGIRSGDEGTLRESLDLFKQLDCPYQSARTGWLLGGEVRDEAKRTFESLGVTLPAD